MMASSSPPSTFACTCACVSPRTRAQGAHSARFLPSCERALPLRRCPQLTCLRLCSVPPLTALRSIVEVNSASSEAWALDLAGNKEGTTATLEGVYTASSGQGDAALQSDVVDELVDSCLGAGGSNVATILCYGQVGSGTTTTVFGGSRSGPGIVHRAVEKAGAYGPSPEVSISLVYLETLYDLLQPATELSLAETARGTRIVGASYQKVRGASSLDSLLRDAFVKRERIVAGIASSLRSLCHTIVSIRLSTAPDGVLHVVQLAPPPLVRVSGVAGLAVEEYCSLNTSLKTLERCIAVMAKRKTNRPPFRDSKLTRLLSAALGGEGGKVRLVVCVSPDRSDQPETAAALEFAALAARARIRADGASSADPKALAAKLQADLASVDGPSAELEKELESQLTLPVDALDKLRLHVREAEAARERERKHAADAAKELADARAQASKGRAAAQRELEEVRDQISQLDRQIRGVQSGAGVEQAMATLRASAQAETETLRKELAQTKAKVSDAKASLSTLASQGAQMAAVLPDVAQRLTQLGSSYAADGLVKEALLLFMNAITIVESVCGPEDVRVVEPLVELAELYVAQKRDDDAVALYKRAYAIDKERIGPDHPRVGRHLLALGWAYHRQGKADAAALTLDEAKAVLTFALDENHKDVLLCKERIKKLAVIEVDIGKRNDGSASARGNAFVSRMEARLAASGKKRMAKEGEELAKELAEREARIQANRDGMLTARQMRSSSHNKKVSSVAMSRGYMSARGPRAATGDEEEDGGASKMSDEAAALMKQKRDIFEQKLRSRPAPAEPETDEEEELRDLDSDEEADAVAEAETRMAEILAATIKKAVRREAWAEVVDGAEHIAQLIAGARNAKPAFCAAALRVLTNGLRSGGYDESRRNATLAVLMVLEWCVPTVDAAFRQQLSVFDRWMRRLADLARKDTSEKALVRNSIFQLISNWAAWYSDEPECQGFAEAYDMLDREGFRMPAPAPQNGQGAEGAGRDGASAALGGENGAGPSDEKIKSEIAVMREDVDKLAHCLALSDDGTLGSTDLAEAMQAAQDCRGWSKRLDVFLGTQSGNSTARTSGASAAMVSRYMRPQLQSLQAEMKQLVERWEEVAPIEKKQSRTRIALRQGMPVPAFTPRGSVQGENGGGSGHVEYGGATPRTRQMFMLNNPKLLNAQGPLASLASGFTPRGGKGGFNRGDPMTDRSGSRPRMFGADGRHSANDMHGMPESPRHRGLRGDEDEEDEDDGAYGDHARATAQRLPPLHPGVGRSASGAAVPGLSLGGANPKGLKALDLAKAGNGNANGSRLSIDLSPAKQLQHLDLARPGDNGNAMAATDDWFDTAYFNAWQEGSEGLQDTNSQLFLQEVAILQMQADGWKTEWSMAMQDNERLRAALYDAQEALAEHADGSRSVDMTAASHAAQLALSSAGGGGLSVSLPEASEQTPEQWKALCAQIARGAADERAALLDEMGRMRVEVDEMRDRFGELSVQRDDAELRAQSEKASVAHWKASAEREMAMRAQLERDHAKALARRAELASSAKTGSSDEMKAKLVEALAAYDAKNDEFERTRSELEGKLTAAYSEHRMEVERLTREKENKEEELQTAYGGVQRWKGQWQDLLSEKHSLTAELQTIRAEFAKTSSTYDKEIDALKEALDKQRRAADELRERWESEMAEKNQFEVELQLSARGGHKVTEQERRQLVTEISAAKSAAARAEQAASTAMDERDTLARELANLKSEVEELTISHDLEVERLREKWAELEADNESLTADLAEKTEALEKALQNSGADSEQRVQQLTEQVDSLNYRLNETQSLVREAKAALKKEQKAREESEEAMREAREAADELEKELDAKEESQGTELADLRVAKEKLNNELADVQARMAESVGTLTSQLAQAKEALKGAEERATEFARKYGNEFFLRKQLHNQLQEMVGNLRVYCRVRPPNKQELAVDGDNGIAVTTPDEQSLVVNDKDDQRNPTRRFDYNMVYGPKSTQEEVFRDTEPLMTSVLDGFNVCIFAYGQSGSGKTFTMEGTPDQPGLVFRAVSRLFEVVNERQEQGYSTELFLGMVEIYNETLRDLLADPKEVRCTWARPREPVSQCRGRDAARVAHSCAPSPFSYGRPAVLVVNTIAPPCPPTTRRT